MPGSVPLATPVGVLPRSLFTAFTQLVTWEQNSNDYANGENQRLGLTDTSRKAWGLSERLLPQALTDLRDMYDSHNGEQIPFIFYDPFLTEPPFSYDPTGSAPAGRFVAHFQGSWSQSMGIRRGDIGLKIIELARAFPGSELLDGRIPGAAITIVRLL